MGDANAFWEFFAAHRAHELLTGSGFELRPDVSEPRQAELFMDMPARGTARRARFDRKSGRCVASVRWSEWSSRRASSKQRTHLFQYGYQGRRDETCALVGCQVLDRPVCPEPAGARGIAGLCLSCRTHQDDLIPDRSAQLFCESSLNCARRPAAICSCVTQRHDSCGPRSDGQIAYVKCSSRNCDYWVTSCATG